MEGSLSITCNLGYLKFNLDRHLKQCPLSPQSSLTKLQFTTSINRQRGSVTKPLNLNGHPKSRICLCATQISVHSPAVAEEEEALNRNMGSVLPNDKDEMFPKIDKSGRFCSPRAARELALSVIYAACLEGSDPVRLFDKRLSGPREPGYVFDKTSLMQYNHMSFSGPPVATDTSEEADQLLQQLEAESLIEAEVLSAPPKLVYSKLVLRFARKLLVAVLDRWDRHVLVIDKVAPLNWKNEPASRILEFSILHLAMSEMSVLGTRHPIVINEAVDLAKRFCDGAAPRIVNGCLRSYLKDIEGRSMDTEKNAQQKHLRQKVARHEVKY